MKPSILSLLLLAVALKLDAEPAFEVTYGRDGNGAMSQTQDQKTIICPVLTQNLYEGHVQYGPRTRFIVKNTASEPVVISFVERNGTEVSAATGHTIPAHMDPEASLAPGVTKVFAAHEGHVFHVRSATTGELLLQHRAGLIPIENKYNREIESCPTSSRKNDQDPSVRPMRTFPQWSPAKLDRYNVAIPIDVGFHNTIQSNDGTPCPVNFYFVENQNANNNKRPPKYMERFSFHLGTNGLAKWKDDAWDANTKYEGTFLGHEFVARLAHDDSVAVDYIALTSIKVQDCGKKKKEAIKSAAHSNAIVIPVGKHNTAGEDVNVNSTEWEAVFHQLNTTETRRGLYFKMYSE